MVLVLSVLLLGLMLALSTSLFMMVKSNISSSSSFCTGLELRRYAENGVQLALYELRYNVGGSDGCIGTQNWLAANDVGKDGYAATQDEGEGDGLPTPGEPNLNPASIGPAASGLRLLVRSSDTAWAGVKRIVSTAYSGSRTATIEAYAKGQANPIPLGAAYVEGGDKWNLSGPFLISGIDHNPDGTLGPNPPIPGIATSTGYEVPFETQLSKFSTQIIGEGGNLSIEEFPKPDFDTPFNQWKTLATRFVGGGSYSSVTWGDWTHNDYQVTYCSGDLAVSSGTLAGVLLVEGKITFSGNTRIVGLVLVKGSVVFSGGGATKVYGELWSKQPIDFKMSGDSAIIYSSYALNKVSGMGGQQYQVLHWSYLK